MSILIPIYLFSIAGACIYSILLQLIVEPLLTEEEKKTDYHYKNYLLWKEGPFAYRLLVVLMPIINSVLSLGAIMLIFMQIKYWWFFLGRFVVRRFTKSPKRFLVKEWIVRKLFTSHIDVFYNHFENDVTMQLITKVLKRLHDEKRKSEPESETKSEPDKKD